MAMRYQGDHSEILYHYPSNNVENDSNTHLNRGSSEGKGTMSKGASSSKRSHNNVGIFKEQPVEGNQPSEDPKEGGGSLLQLCTKKRNRDISTESRTLLEDSNIQSRKSTRIKRQVTKSEKQRVPVQSHETVHSRSTNLGPCTPLREPSHRFIKRNSEDLNDDHLLNNGLQQRVDRQSPAPVEKNAEAVGCFRPKAIVTTRSVSKNLRNSTPSNTEACAPPDKIDMETFQWPRIFLQLSWKEKEEDFLIIKGTKPSKRPKKRPKHVEKVLQNCCPGSWLSNIGKGRYDVRK